jgi:hypothetical protein
VEHKPKARFVLCSLGVDWGLGCLHDIWCLLDNFTKLHDTVTSPRDMFTKVHDIVTSPRDIFTKMHDIPRSRRFNKKSPFLKTEMGISYVLFFILPIGEKDGDGSRAYMSTDDCTNVCYIKPFWMEFFLNKSLDFLGEC